MPLFSTRESLTFKDRAPPIDPPSILEHLTDINANPDC